jgi:predicted O-linked N-acetylglucosamine transferase (SPINDLY family)
MSTINTALAQIDSLMRQGQLPQAESLCRELLQQAPHEPQAWAWLGVLMLQSFRHPEAEAAFRQATQLKGDVALYWGNLCIAVNNQGRCGEAERYARQALQLDASVSAHWNNLAGCLNDQRRWADALQAAQRALERDPNNASALSNLGAAEQGVGNFAAAQQAFERSLTLAPGRQTAITRYASLLAELGQRNEAIRLLEDVLARSPTMSAARYSLAYIKTQQWLLPEAEVALRMLLTSDPNHADAWSLLGLVLLKQAQASEAIAAFRRAAEISGASDRYSRLLSCLSYAEDATPESLLAEHRQWAGAYAGPLLPPNPPAAASKGQTPLRIGFVSTDFGLHPVSFLLLSALEHLDKGRCKVICYSDRFLEDEYTARFRAVADIWHTTGGLADEGLAEQVRRDEIDILFDLMGHTGNRMLLFARQPAPVQLTWLGYVGTTGLSAIDFVLADRFHVRPDEESAYAESVLRMPNGYACYAPPFELPEVQPPPALAAGYLTFGSFNNPAKFSPSAFNAWADILSRVPTAKLLLKYGGLDQAPLQESIRADFARRSIDPARILLEGWSPIRDLFPNYHRIDIALDTQPYSGGVTTCEALWMGVPVITWPGKTFAGRHSTSHLSNAGYSQFVAADSRGYIDLAVDWANRLEELSALRLQMRDQVRSSPLCDAPRFARDFVDILTGAWQNRITAVRD